MQNKTLKSVALIDIGSNSVRLVIYDGLKRSPIALFNEKVLCGLAKNMNSSGVLNPAGVVKAKSAIARFVKIAKFMQVESLNLFATSAVRDADDGMDFVDYINQAHNVNIEVISGEDEAKYAALGIVSSIVKPNGVVGDLGGGSFELSSIDKNKVTGGSSYPIGPLRFTEQKLSKEEIKSIIVKNIDNFPIKENLEYKSFYAVGGAFRNLAKIHMYRKNYPLRVIHNYKVSAEEIYPTAKIVLKMNKEALSRIKGLSSKRAKFMPYAALIIKSVIEKGEPKDIIFSTSGVREGYLFSKIDDDLKNDDPLISGCTEMMNRMLISSDYGYELSEWMQPLFNEKDSKRQKHLRLAASIMSELSCYENTEYRADLAYRKILDSSLTGLSHKERVFIAKSLYSRYKIYSGDSLLSNMASLLSSRKTQNAQIIGAAMRLARTISANSIGVLPQTKIVNKKKSVVLNISNEIKDVCGESVEKRLSQLSEILGKSNKIRFI